MPYQSQPAVPMAPSQTVHGSTCRRSDRSIALELYRGLLQQQRDALDARDGLEPLHARDALLRIVEANLVGVLHRLALGHLAQGDERDEAAVLAQELHQLALAGADGKLEAQEPVEAALAAELAERQREHADAEQHGAEHR